MVDFLSPAAAATQVESLSETVRQLFINGEEVTQNFIWKDIGDAEPGVFDAPASLLPIMDIPIIDMNLLTSPSFRDKEIEKLRKALSLGGSFQVINHGISTTLLDRMREVAHQFYALPSENKQNYCRDHGKPEGYRNDIVSEHQVAEWAGRFNLLVSPEEERRSKFWPDNPKNFREIVHEYTMKLEVMRDILIKAMGISLKLNENSFSDMLGEQSMLVARFNYYPPCPRPDLILGFKPHTDGSVISIVLQDKEVEGLQFLKDNHWYRVPINPESLLVNVGDQAQIMSNGIFKSPVHRVVTNSERKRISVVVFCLPNSEKEIEPIYELVNETRPRLYKKLKDYANIFIQCYQQGKKPIETAII